MNWLSNIVVSIGALISMVFGGHQQVITNDIPLSASSSVELVQNTNNIVTSEKPVNARINLAVSTSSINASASVKITGTSLQTENCGSQDCFYQKFSTCSPATLDSSLGPITFHYEIIKSITGGCQVSMEYTKNPDPAWVNKQMLCTLNNNVDFQSEAQRAMSNIQNDPNMCTGPLADGLREMFSNTGPLSHTSSSTNVPVSSNTNLITNSSNLITVDGTSMTVSTMGTSFHPGSKVNISWGIQSGNDSIYLVTSSNGNIHTNIVTGLSGGVYTWTIPSSVSPGSYYIAISHDNLQSGLMSKTFQIVTN